MQSKVKFASPRNFVGGFSRKLVGGSFLEKPTKELGLCMFSMVVVSFVGLNLIFFY
jgi:hypothetical protein